MIRLGFIAAALGALFVVAAPTTGEIRFQEVTARAGISYVGPSFGASWGDFNGDGYPDLWVSNHADTPSLYLNRGDGTFSDIILDVWSGPGGDSHGVRFPYRRVKGGCDPRTSRRRGCAV